MSLSFSQLSPNAGHIIAKFALATTQEVVEGQQWYRTAYEIASRLARNNNITVEKAAGVIAALSPNNHWDNNCLDAERLITTFIKGDQKDCMNLKLFAYPKMVEKALIILNQPNNGKYEEIIRILNGPKITAFCNCILEKKDICIDFHAHSIWLGERLTSKKSNIGKRLREQIKSDYLDATEWINLEMNTNYLPSDIQAITWVCHRRIYNI